MLRTSCTYKEVGWVPGGPGEPRLSSLRGRRKENSPGKLILPSDPHSHLLKSPHRWGLPLPGRQEKARRASLFLSRERGTRSRLMARLPRPERGREGRREGARAGPTARPGPAGLGSAIAFPLPGSPPFQPAREGSSRCSSTAIPSPAAAALPHPRAARERQGPRPRSQQHRCRCRYLPSAGSGREAVLPGKHAGLLC